MQRVTQALYWVIGVIGIVGGLLAVFGPALILGPAADGTLAGHLAREQGAGFVFIGLVAAWSARHADVRPHPLVGLPLVRGVCRRRDGQHPSVRGVRRDAPGRAERR